MSYSASPERNSQGKRLNEETEQISIQWSLHIQKENSNPKDCSTQLRKPDNRNHCGKTAIATAEAMPDWSSLGQRLPCLLPLPQHRATSKCQTHFLNQSHNSVLFCSLSTHSCQKLLIGVDPQPSTFPMIKPVCESLKNANDSHTFLYGKLLVASLCPYQETRKQREKTLADPWAKETWLISEDH